jgi:hypothetical protein
MACMARPLAWIGLTPAWPSHEGLLRKFRIGRSGLMSVPNKRSSIEAAGPGGETDRTPELSHLAQVSLDHVQIGHMQVGNWRNWSALNELEVRLFRWPVCAKG